MIITQAGRYKLRENYEFRRFRHYYALLSGIFFVPVFCVVFWCSQYNMVRTCIGAGLYLLFAVCAYLLFYRSLYPVLKDIEDISGTMVDVVEGREDYAAEIYKEGALGELYTNFYKMVSTLRESQMAAWEEKKFLQDTISDISHQLKTPLASLNVFVDLLGEDKVTDKDREKQILGEARNQLDRMEWMVLSILKLARIEAGAVSFERKPCSAAEIAARAAEGVAYLTKARQQTVEITRTDGGEPGKESAKSAPVMLNCDREWLTEALINLLKNASDYSPENTRIQIEMENNSLYTRFYVRDWGTGIPEEALPHIFERFYRVNHEVNPNSVGIGLSLTKSIVEGMNGRITVRSRVGEYTCFILTFMKL